MPVTGKLLIGRERVGTEETFGSRDPVLGAAVGPGFAVAATADVDRACVLAAQAFDPYRAADLSRRASFLEQCADNLGSVRDELLEWAGRETGLPRGRLEGELARTANQLRLFADVIRQGDWLGLRVDRALPDRVPLPRPDIRQRKVPLGPVVVFGASNFPLAFSAAGGDVAAALAAGCPVIVKAHPLHPGTSELAATAISTAAQQLGLPEGVYSHLSGNSDALGSALVRHPAVKAVAFTGSRRGGLALASLAAARAEPIPVYAEMSSINPVVLLPAALSRRAESIATGFVASLTLGAGQFCTNPGLVLAIEGPDLERFAAGVQAAVEGSLPAPMLSAAISRAYREGVDRLGGAADVRVVAQAARGKSHESNAAVFSVKGADFLSSPMLSDEVFGPSSLLIRCADLAELLGVLDALQGQLTATLQLEAEDHAAAAQIMPILEKRVGRILVNGWPTGVEVCAAMVHGGPFPATSDSRTTSVGTLAIERFLRPVCYQDVPEMLLPPELRTAVGSHYRVLIDGKYPEST